MEVLNINKLWESQIKCEVRAFHPACFLTADNTRKSMSQIQAKDLLGKRILVQTGNIIGHIYSAIVEEISPSGSYVRLRNDKTKELDWSSVAEIQFLEQLVLPCQ